MAILTNFHYVSVGDLEDPDDYRPNSFLSFNVDPGEEGNRVEQMVVFREKIAPGDCIPLHKHTMEEIMFVDEGELEAQLGDKKQVVKAGGIIFIAARELHGFKNAGDSVARISAVFPSRIVDIHYSERNPAPGTDNDAIQPPVRIDIRAVAEGRLEEAVEPISPKEFEE